MSSLNSLIHQSVDYAGLFPPAALPLLKVVSNYAKYQQSAECSMLGRLIIPALRLDDFAEIASQLAISDNHKPWRISALIPTAEELDSGEFDTIKIESAQEAILRFNHRHSPTIAVVDSVEVKTLSTTSIAPTIAAIPNGQSAFLEVPWDDAPGNSINQIAELKGDKFVFAKIRTGEVTAELVPTPVEVARFISACAKHQVAFKATAGLHHPIRASQKLTYATDAPAAVLHGFVNVFVAAALAFELKMDEPLLEEVLAETDAAAFELSQQEIGWKGYRLNSKQVKSARKNAIVSFGSCSFTEPTSELVELPNVEFSAAFE